MFMSYKSWLFIELAIWFNRLSDRVISISAWFEDQVSSEDWELYDKLSTAKMKYEKTGIYAEE